MLAAIFSAWTLVFALLTEVDRFIAALEPVENGQGSFFNYLWNLTDAVNANLIATFIATVVTTILLKPVFVLVKRKVRRRLPRWLLRVARWFDPSTHATPDKFEELYLGWLIEDLRKYIRPLVPTPAHTKEPSPLRAKQKERLQKFKQDERLLKFNPGDYLREPGLRESGLSARLEYGHGVRIKDLVKELRHFRPIVVLGEPGSGKSVCLRQLAYDLCLEGLQRLDRGEAPLTIPIHVQMTTYDGWKDGDRKQPMPVIEFLKESLRGRPSVSEPPATSGLVFLANRLEDILRDGRATLIFDALDEMPRDSHEARYLTLMDFVDKHERAGNQFVFSCRVLDYDSLLDVSEIIIDRFDLELIKQYLQENAPTIADALYHEIEHDKALEDLAGNPFFLQALTRVNLNPQPGGGLVLPTSRGQLLKEYAKTLLDEDVALKQKRDLAEIDGGLDTLRQFLRELAFALQQGGEGRTSATPDSLVDLRDRHPQWQRLLGIAHRARILGKSDQEADQLVDALPPDLEPQPPSRIEFMHHRLQEYFAAEQLGTLLLQGEPIERYVEDIWWQETLIFAIGLSSQPEVLITRILEPRDDVGGWLAEVSTCARDPFHADEAKEAKRVIEAEAEAAAVA